jgi:hypothetical protein
MSKVGATWIGKNKTAQKDYDKQVNMSKRTGKMYWDDTRFNKLKKGDYFGFIDSRRNRLELVIYKITNVIGKKGRDKSWSNNGYIEGVNYDTSKRNALELSSKPVKRVNWNSYIQDVGYKQVHLQCTMYLRPSDLIKMN